MLFSFQKQIKINGKTNLFSLFVLYMLSQRFDLFSFQFYTTVWLFCSVYVKASRDIYVHQLFQVRNIKRIFSLHFCTFSSLHEKFIFVNFDFISSDY